MKTHLLTLCSLAVALTACQAITSPTSGMGTSVSLQADAKYQTVTQNSHTFHLAEAKSYPLIDSWTYYLPSENKANWTRRIDIARYKKVNATEIYDQMVGATLTQLQETNAANRTVCFVTEREDGQIKEPNIWRFSNTSGPGKPLTYGTGLVWRFPAGPAFNSFMKGEFPNTCEAMRNQRVLTPPAISKP